MSYLEPFMQTVLQISISTAAVIGFLLLLIPVWQQRYSARWRKVIWLVIAIRLLVPFSIELSPAPVQIQMDFQRIVTVHSQPVYTDDIPAVPEYTAAPSDLAVNNSSVTPSDMTAQNGIVWNQGMILSVIWIAGVLAFVLWHGVQYIMFHRKVFASAMPLEDGDWLLNHASADMDLHHLPEVLISAGVQSPMLVGFKKPVIVLPERIYGEQELLLILRHELMHYKHHDLWYKLILLAANAVHWFNPLVYLMLRQAGRDVEQVCDDNVVAGQDMAYRKAYSLTILNTMANQKGVALSTCLSKDAQNVKKRFAGILQPKQYKRGAAVFLGIVLLAAVASGCLRFTEPVTDNLYLKLVEEYLPEGITFSEGMTYEQYSSEDGYTTHYWADWEDTTGETLEEVQKNAANRCWISMVTNQNNQILEYQINIEPGYRIKEQLPEVAINESEARKLAEKFLKKKAKIQNLQLREWEPGPAQILKQDLPEGFIGWISDGDIKNYHHEILVDMQHGYICAYRYYFDDDQENPISLWEYTGYLDAFPWENTEDSSLFSDDYDGDGKTDRVYRSAVQEEGYYQYQIEFASGEVLKLEKPVSNIGYPRIDGADVTGDGQNEIIFQVGYPTSTNPLAFGELVVYEQQKGNYLPMQLPFEDGEEPYQNLLTVIYSKADGQAVKVSVPGTDFAQVVPIEDENLWNGYQYSSTYTRGETMQHSIWAYKIRNVDGKAQLICSIQLFDKWSEWGLDITLGYKNGRMIIDEIEFCEDIYAEWT